jgi:two-component system, chemotaxis family, sensor kinase Cph1
MAFECGDHICLIYSNIRELAATASDFLADGLTKGERCWYVASGPEEHAVRAALRRASIDVEAHTARGALRLIPASEAYLVHGQFDPEATMRVFNDAIEKSLADGFTGFRAAAEMSWALEPNGGLDRLITYEALLRTLFANCRVAGLCLYNRRDMPLAVIDGALSTHPVVGTNGNFRPNPFYDANVNALRGVNEATVHRKLREISVD